MTAWLSDAIAGIGLVIFIGCAFLLANAAPLLVNAL
jgi:hypothetical protein